MVFIKRVTDAVSVRNNHRTARTKNDRNGWKLTSFFRMFRMYKSTEGGTHVNKERMETDLCVDHVSFVEVNGGTGMTGLE